MGQKTRNEIDFHLANIEEALRTQKRNDRENAQISVARLREILDVYHVEGNPNAVTLVELQ